MANQEMIDLINQRDRLQREFNYALASWEDLYSELNETMHALRKMVASQHAGAITEEMLEAWETSRNLINQYRDFSVGDYVRVKWDVPLIGFTKSGGIVVQKDSRSVLVKFIQEPGAGIQTLQRFTERKNGYFHPANWHWVSGMPVLSKRNIPVAARYYSERGGA